LLPLLYFIRKMLENIPHQVCEFLSIKETFEKMWRKSDFGTNKSSFSFWYLKIVFQQFDSFQDFSKFLQNFSSIKFRGWAKFSSKWEKIAKNYYYKRRFEDCLWILNWWAFGNLNKNLVYFSSQIWKWISFLSSWQLKFLTRISLPWITLKSAEISFFFWTSLIEKSKTLKMERKITLNAITNLFSPSWLESQKKIKAFESWQIFPVRHLLENNEKSKEIKNSKWNQNISFFKDGWYYFFLWKADFFLDEVEL